MAFNTEALNEKYKDIVKTYTIPDDKIPSLVELNNGEPWQVKKLSFDEIARVRQNASKGFLNLGELLQKLIDNPNDKQTQELIKQQQSGPTFGTIVAFETVLKGVVYPDNLDVRSVRKISETYPKEFENLYLFIAEIYEGPKADKKK